MNIPRPLQNIHQKLRSINVKAIVVGGYVRDTLMEIPSSKDIDIEVYEIDDIDVLKSTLSSLGKVHEVGKSFGVLKLTLEGYDFDISLPRTESKTGQGHKGFDVILDSTLTFTQASTRRDFTINAIGYDLDTLTYLDPHKGQADIQTKTLRVVSETSFIEDPLRVLRAMQFVARFNLTLEPKSLALCQQMVQNKLLDQLPKERVFEEIKKLLLRSTKPSVGFALLDQLGAQFTEVDALHGIEQNERYHPEGDVYIHTMMALDAMRTLKIDDEKDRLLLMLAVLCHDFGKPSATTKIDGKIQSIGHEQAGIVPTRSFLNKLTYETALFQAISPLVEHHLKPSMFYAQGAKKPAIRRLATQVNIEQLIYVAHADFLGRTTKESLASDFKAGRWLKEQALALEVLQQKPKALLQGKDLIALGLAPGVRFKTILDKAYQAQLDDFFSNHEQAVAWLKKVVV